MSRVNIAIAVSEDARLGIYEIAASCRAFGFEHASTLAGIGVLTGSAELEILPRIRRLPGVVAVEIEREIDSRQRGICKTPDTNGRVSSPACSA